jgi:hypothetical protein
MNDKPVRPMLDDFELPLVQVLHTEEDQIWVEQGIPQLEGSLLQRLGRASTRIHVEGVMADDKSLEQLEKLRKKHHAAQPVPFVADIMTATEIKQVLIEDLDVRELAGKPRRYFYCMDLLEFVPTKDPAPRPKDPDPTPDCVDQKGTIEVTVVLPQGQTDFTGIVVRLQRTNIDNAPIIEIDQQTNGIFRRENLDAGTYHASAFRRN